MKTTAAQTGNPIGIRFLLLLIPLFAAIAMSAFALVYPGQINAGLSTLELAAPAANPEVCVMTTDGEALLLPPETMTALAAVGEITPVHCLDTDGADGTSMRLLSMDAAALARAAYLIDGRMPQNETECIVVPLDTAETAIGAAIRPCLTDTDDPLTLTVVGIGENVHATLAPLTEDGTRFLVLTLPETADAAQIPVNTLYLSDCKTEDPIADVRAAYASTADARVKLQADNASAELKQHTEAAEEADNAILAHRITVQAIENRLDTAQLCVDELETNMMDAVAAVQAERQAFVSDMEFNEYYSLRQVDLIPRRDRAEEGFVLQEEAIEEINGQLLTAYAERDRIRAELARAQETAAQLEEAAVLAQKTLDEHRALAAQPNTAQEWSITAREDAPGHVRLTAHAAEQQTRMLLFAIIAFLVFTGVSVPVFARSKTSWCPTLRFALISGVIALPALFLGACILTRHVFGYHFPSLAASMPLQVFSPDTIWRAGLLLPFAMIISALTAYLGRRLSRTER